MYDLCVPFGTRLQKRVRLFNEIEFDNDRRRLERAYKCFERVKKCKTPF